MNKNIKKTLAAGLVTAMVGASVVSSNALCKKTITSCKTKGIAYLYVNGKKCKILLGCNNKPSKGDNSSTQNNGNCNINSNNNNGSCNTNNSQNNGNCNINNNNNNNNTNTNNNSNTNNNNNQNNNNTNNNNNGNNNSNINNNNNTNNNANNNNNTNSSDKNDSVVQKPSTDNTTSNNDQSSSNSFLSFQKEVVRLVNVERTKRGLSELSFNTELSHVATLKSQDMINKNYFDHTSPTYGSPFDMMKKFNISYRSAGENIAMGQRTPAEVVEAWMNSKGHRENILNSSYTDLGVGVAKKSDGTLYWTQMFIGR